jgi:undecaprenyl pyrophosphate synthase
MQPNEFVAMSDEDTARFIRENGGPRVVTLVDDGTRRTGLVSYRMNLSQEEFMLKLNRRLARPFMDVYELIFRQGADHIFTPAMTHGRYALDQNYQRQIIAYTNEVLTGEFWRTWFHEQKIHCRIYGDREMLLEQGYGKTLEYADTLDAETKHYDRKLWLGFACSTAIEQVRLAEAQLLKTGRRHDHHPYHNGYPDLVRAYYGEEVPPVDVFIRPCECRLSETMPPFLGEYAECYFTPIPATEMKGNWYRKVVYDYMYVRRRTFGAKSYSENLEPEALAYLREYYEKNAGTVMGLGHRVGGFWLWGNEQVPTQP